MYRTAYPWEGRPRNDLGQAFSRGVFSRRRARAGSVPAPALKFSTWAGVQAFLQHQAGLYTSLIISQSAANNDSDDGLRGRHCHTNLGGSACRSTPARTRLRLKTPPENACHSGSCRQIYGHMVSAHITFCGASPPVPKTAPLLSSTPRYTMNWSATAVGGGGVEIKPFSQEEPSLDWMRSGNWK